MAPSNSTLAAAARPRSGLRYPADHTKKSPRREREGFPRSIDELLEMLQYQRIGNLALVGFAANKDSADRAQMVAMTDALAGNRTLRGLDLSRPWAGSDIANAAIAALSVNNTLETLDLSIAYRSRWHDVESIDMGGIMALQYVLQFNTTLRSLHLRGQFLGDVDACALASGLKFNTGLRLLDLQCNRITDSGACALSVALTLNRTLESLLLVENRIGVAGATALADPYQARTQQQTLALLRRQARVGAVELVCSVFANSMLRTISLDMDMVLPEMTIASLRKRHRSKQWGVPTIAHPSAPQDYMDDVDDEMDGHEYVGQDQQCRALFYSDSEDSDGLL